MNKNILTYLSSPNQLGGTPVKVLQLVKDSKYNHFVYFYSNGFAPDRFESDYKLFCEWAKCFRPSNGLLSQLRDIIRIIDKHEINIIQTFFFRGIVVASAIKILRRNVKVLFSFESGFMFPGRIKSLIAKVCIPFVDLFVYISKDVRAKQLSNYPSLAKRDGRIIYNGAEKRVDSMSFSGIRQNNRIVLVCVGNFIRWKNQIVLLQAMDIIVNKYKYDDILLNLVGGGGEYETDKQYVLDHCLEKHVKMDGFSADVGSALNNADIILHPAYDEGFGIAVVEGMMVGLLPILSNKGALPELIEDGVNGFLLSHDKPEEWADKIIELYNSPDKLKLMGESAKARAESLFSVKKYVENIDALYNEMLFE